MGDISTWSTNANANNSPSPNGFPENMAPSGVNNSCREVMAAVKRFYDEIIGSTGIVVDAAGLLSEKSTYDSEENGFTYLAYDTGDIYVKITAGWSDPIPIQGPPGSDADVTTHESTYDHTLIETALQAETDPVFLASDAADITATDIVNLGNLSGTNTGDQNLSGYSLTSHNHSGVYEPAGTAASAIAALTGDEILAKIVSIYPQFVVHLGGAVAPADDGTVVAQLVAAGIAADNVLWAETTASPTTTTTTTAAPTTTTTTAAGTTTTTTAAPTTTTTTAEGTTTTTTTAAPTTTTTTTAAPTTTTTTAEGTTTTTTTTTTGAPVGFTDAFTGTNNDAPNASYWDTSALDADFTATIQSNRLRLAKGTTTGQQEGFLPTVDVFPVAAGRKFTLDGYDIGSSLGNYIYITDMSDAATSYTASTTHGIKMIAETGGNFVALHVGELDISESWEMYIFMTTWNGSTLSHSTVHTVTEGAGFANLGIEIVDATTIKILSGGAQVGTNKTIPSMGSNVRFGPLYRGTGTIAFNVGFDNAVVS